MATIADLFPATYAASRLRFRSYLDHIRARWPSARMVTRPLPTHHDLTLDWIEAEPLADKEKILVFTLGEHGIEGFVGSAMLHVFMVKFLPLLDPHTTGLALVHAINPWGMHHRRRVNAANVDLNRNFVWNERDLDPTANPDYARICSYLNPRIPVESSLMSVVSFLGGLVRSSLRIGPRRMKTATLLGQYRFGRGVYFGGETRQPETLAMMEIFKAALETYSQTLLLDIHTGYGPRPALSLVNSVYEKRSSKELKKAFGYRDVVKADPSEFYAIQGDMIDYIYALARSTAPARRLYATSFEFGTFGHSFRSILRALRALIDENSLYWNGAGSDAAEARTRREFSEMFDPSDARWQANAVVKARLAFQGILKAEGFM